MIRGTIETARHTYVRFTTSVANLLCFTAQGVFEVPRMMLPDVYGIFKFVVDYNRLGYSHIHLEEQVPIRPFRHDEYERFIVAAYPYYSGILSVMAGFFVFGLSVLYTK